LSIGTFGRRLRRNVGRRRRADVGRGRIADVGRAGRPGHIGLAWVLNRHAMSSCNLQAVAGPLRDPVSQHSLGRSALPTGLPS
jgi:hypothetical protein